MKKEVLIVFLIIGILGLVSSLEINDLSCSNAINYKDQIIGKEIPSEAPFDNEIINVYVSEEVYGNLVIKESVIRDFSCSENEDATYSLSIQNLETVKKFLESEDFIDSYKSMKKSGEIEVKGIGFGKKLKLAFVNFILKFF
jgi:hypothetical protein